MERVQPIGTQGAAERLQDPFVARKVAVLSLDYVARAFQLLAEAYGDGRAGLVVHAIFAANTAHLDDEKIRRIAGPDAVLPDEVRRPIRVSHLAKLLGLPLETTRQQVRRLIEAGLCVRLPGGLIVPKSVMQRPETIRAVTTNLGYIRQLMRDLRDVRLDGAPPE